jgi:transcriptional regulator with XRE-family HTH domain
MSLGTRIKAARERLSPRVTQQDLANHFGITDKAVSSWERNETVPDPDKLVKLRDILRVPFAWLLAGTGTPPPPEDTAVRMDDLLVETYGKQETAAKEDGSSFRH